MRRPYALSCHCDAIKLAVDADLADLEECNCSTSARSGLLHWKVPVEVVRLLTQKRNLSTYLWRDADGGTQFCPTWGTAMMRTDYRDRIAVNARCVEGSISSRQKWRAMTGATRCRPGPTI